MRKDLPRLLDGLRARFPAVTWHLAPAIGEDARLLAAMTAIALDALSPPPGAGDATGG